MKTFIGFFLGLGMLASCDVYVTEPAIDYRNRIIGLYEVEEYSETYDEYTYYDFSISKSSYSRREIYLDNFYASGLEVYAYVDKDRITIPFQSVKGYEIEGTGYVYRDEIQLNYRVKDVYHEHYTDFCDTQAYRVRY